MLESLVLFAILVLTAKAAGISNAMTLLGAQLFFWGRVATPLFTSRASRGCALLPGACPWSG